MSRKWKLVFTLHYIALALGCAGSLGARQLAYSVTGRHVRPKGSGVFPGFLLSNGTISRSRNSWKCSVLPAEKVYREPYIKGIAYYNQFPAFVEGMYSFSKVDINTNILEDGNIISDDILAAIDAIDSIKHFCLLQNGHLRVIMHGDDIDRDESTERVDKGSSMSNYSLGIIKNSCNRDHGVEEWMQHLKQREFNAPSITEIVDTTSQIDLATQRKKLESALAQLIAERGIQHNHVEPIGWKYIPTQKLGEILVRLAPFGKVITWLFKLLPGPRPLVINEVSIKMRSDIGKDAALKSEGKHQDTRFARCIVKTIDNVKFRLGTLRDVEITSRGNRRNNGYFRRQDYTAEAPTQNEVIKTLDNKEHFIEIYGNGRTRANLLIRLMQIVDDSMVNNDTTYDAMDGQRPTVEGDPYPQPFWVQKLHIMVDGKYYKFLPLLAFYVENTGLYHLCTREVQIQPKSRPNLWNPWTRNYMMRNTECVPRMYRCVSFAETQHFEISRQNIQWLLMHYKPLQNLDIQGFYSGTVDDQKAKVKNIIHIDEQRQYMVNIVT